MLRYCEHQDWVAQTSIKYKSQLKLKFYAWIVHKINLHLRFN